MVEPIFQAFAGFISQQVQAVMPTATVSSMAGAHCICFQLTSTSSVIERLPVPPLSRGGSSTWCSRASPASLWAALLWPVVVGTQSSHSSAFNHEIINSVSHQLGSPPLASHPDSPRVGPLTGSAVRQQVWLDSGHYQSHVEGHNITPAGCGSSHFLVASLTESHSILECAVEADNWSLSTLTPHKLKQIYKDWHHQSDIHTE